MSQLAVIETMSPIEIYGSGNLKSIIGKIVDEVRSTPTDISTPKGRKEIASLAHKVARSKTFLDDLGKQLGEEAKKKLDAINAERKVARDELDKLKDEVRKPLTEWEERDAKRIADHERELFVITNNVKFASDNFHTLSSDEIAKIIMLISNICREWEEFELRAQNDKTYALGRLDELLSQKKKQEADAAELAAHRLAEAARIQKEREDKIAQEAAERARIAAESIAKAEANRVALAAEMERQKFLKEKQEQEFKISQAEIFAKAEAQKAIDDAFKAKIDLQNAVENERIKIEKEKAALIAAEEKRQANKRHVAKINNEIMAALNTHVEQPMNESQVKSIIFAIATGKIPHTRISY
ncbi:MAG TPA: hypothetical protein VIJ14_04120 [Rhabdochlamydiaceae bacterium]